MMVFLYDDAGSPIGFLYRTSAYAKGVYDAYFYEKNFFGDVIGIYDESGSCVAKYNYNAWGVCTVQTNVGGIADLNPIRYRGYYYDTHTKLYYLQSRYYNPEWGRFISPDSALYSDHFLGYNLYVYCYNNPVKYYDPTGMFAVETAAGWAGSMWWLNLADGPVPIGDIIYWSGVAISGLILIGLVADSLDDAQNNDVSPPQDIPDSDIVIGKNLPTTGDPNSDKYLYDEKGLKQKRHYGPDGKAEYDIDYRHGGEASHEFPHRHDWDWSNKDNPRRDAIPPFENILPCGGDLWITI